MTTQKTGQSERIRGGSWKVYKKIGAAQFSYIPSTWGTDGFHSRGGCILVEVAPPLSKDVWDWSNKITFGIGIADVQKLLGSPGEKVEMYHEKDQVVKTLKLEPGRDNYEGTAMLYFTEKSNGNLKKASVPLDSGELSVLYALCRYVVPNMVGWL